jgi:hypothetical protein
MSQYIFQTRAYGPDAKGSILTWEDLDNSLLFLSESINELASELLSGSNYLLLEANGTPTQNGLSLSASYALAKTSSPSSTNKFSILAGPGEYFLSSNLEFNTSYIDVISLTGERDIYITGSGTIFVNADNTTVRGIDVDTKNFLITGSFPNTTIKNCKGGDNSFGGYPDPITGEVPSPGYTIASTFIDCEGGNISFAGNGSAYGTFINCTAGSGSFGNYCDGIFVDCISGDSSFATLGDIEGGTLENCVGGTNSFASVGNIGDAILKNCTGGQNSFAFQTSISGILQNCRLTDGNFSSNGVNIAPGGQLIACINDDNTPITYP